MKTLANLIILTLILIGCACSSVSPTKSLTIHQRFEVACTGYGTTIDVLTALNDAHKFSRATVDTISADKAKLHPYCVPASGDYPYSATEAEIQAVESAAAYLKARSKP